MNSRQFSTTAAFFVLLVLAGCSAANDYSMNRAAEDYRVTCMGSDTNDCVNKRIEVNIQFIELTKYKFKQKRDSYAEAFGDEGYETILGILDDAVTMEKKARPGFFDRWFHGDREVGSAPPPYIVGPGFQDAVLWEAVRRMKRARQSVSDTHAPLSLSQKDPEIPPVSKTGADVSGLSHPPVSPSGGVSDLQEDDSTASVQNRLDPPASAAPGADEHETSSVPSDGVTRQEAPGGSDEGLVPLDTLAPNSVGSSLSNTGPDSEKGSASAGSVSAQPDSPVAITSDWNEPKANVASSEDFALKQVDSAETSAATLATLPAVRSYSGPAGHQFPARPKHVFPPRRAAPTSYQLKSKPVEREMGTATNENLVPSAEQTAATATSEGCVAQWVTAFRHENGSDAVVAADQLDEWAGWCASGKRP